ncbi:MAG: hypothetical protein FJ276_19285 [Planctomycetes bacterium]|nr:hypothetical protein [Planctomycetota bacterium]
MMHRMQPVLWAVVAATMATAAGAAEPPETTRVVSRIVGREFLSETVRVGDLNGDGAPEVLFVQNLYGPRIITCLTATTIAGEILWQTGTPSADNGRCYCDLPVRIYDWDRDGRELWRRQMQPGEWCIATRLIRWLGPGQPDCALVYGFSVNQRGPGKSARIYNGQGEVVDELPLQVGPAPGETEYTSDCYGMAADVWGDSREEVLLFGSRGFSIHANTRPLEEPSLYNMTLYPGMWRPAHVCS